jgi:retron-type reverse transcriptase
MKTYKNLYPALCSYDNLFQAYKKAQKGKTRKEYVKAFKARLEENLLELKRELETYAYSPKPLTTFVIRDPKTRVISASHFRDRVVHHAICNILEPIFEREFINDSYANRKGKGTHLAILRFEKFMRSVTGNGRILRGCNNRNAVVGYVLKADIRHYFDSMDHKVLIGILERKVHDRRLIGLIGTILQNHKSHIPGRGMPLGNLTSQFFANVYLNELDRFVKHTLKAKYYIRYVDDFVLLGTNATILRQWAIGINAFLVNALKIDLHPEKSRIISLRNGITFLGFRIFHCYRLLKKSNAIRIWKRLSRMVHLYDDGLISRETVLQSLEGWFAYAGFANTHNLRRRVAAASNRQFRMNPALLEN